VLSKSSSLESGLDEAVFVAPDVVYATEILVEDETPVKQCQPGATRSYVEF
jgi:hypothetical protein